MGYRSLSKYIISFLLIFSVLLGYGKPVYAVEQDEVLYYDDIVFVASDQEENQEIVHLLLAKLVYDYLDGYEGKTVEEYVNDNLDIYDALIWEDSGITYKALYNSIVGQWKIYEVYNRNAVTGFYGVAFMKDDRVIYALRGTDMFTDEFPLDESNDWIATDFKFALMNELSRQFDDFDGSYRLLLDNLKKDGYENVTITLTGHSLGGALVSYGSLVTDSFGYAFDGACGHVIDLVYMEHYLKIDDFSGADDLNNIKFVNYTDDTGYLVADLIQHTNTEFLYEVDRESFVEGMCDNDFISKIADADSHHIWSILSYDENKVFFNQKVSLNEKGYTYMPTEAIYMDVNKNVVEATIEGFDIFAPWEFFFDFDTGYMIDTALGNIKNGRVVLASVSGGELFADNKAGKDEEYDVDTVMYGGKSNILLVGGEGDDVFVAGQGELNTFYGNGGSDTYVVDAVPGQKNIVLDKENDNVKIILRNFQGKDFVEVSSDNIIYLPEGQQIVLSNESQLEDVEIYVYVRDRLRYIGNCQEISEKGSLE